MNKMSVLIRKVEQTGSGSREGIVMLTSPSVAPEANKLVWWGLKSKPLTGPLWRSYLAINGLIKYEIKSNVSK